MQILVGGTASNCVKLKFQEALIDYELPIHEYTIYNHPQSMIGSTACAWEKSVWIDENNEWVKNSQNMLTYILYHEVGHLKDNAFKKNELAQLQLSKAGYIKFRKESEFSADRLACEQLLKKGQQGLIIIGQLLCGLSCASLLNIKAGCGHASAKQEYQTLVHFLKTKEYTVKSSYNKQPKFIVSTSLEGPGILGTMTFTFTPEASTGFVDWLTHLF